MGHALIQSLSWAVSAAHPAACWAAGDDSGVPALWGPCYHHVGEPDGAPYLWLWFVPTLTVGDTRGGSSTGERFQTH